MAQTDSVHWLMIIESAVCAGLDQYKPDGLELIHWERTILLRRDQLVAANRRPSLWGRLEKADTDTQLERR